MKTDAEIGMVLAQIRESALRGVYRRYRPINAHEDVVEMRGETYDALLDALDSIIRHELKEAGCEAAD